MVRQSFDFAELRFFRKGVFASLRRTVSVVVKLLQLSLYRGLSCHREGTLQHLMPWIVILVLFGLLMVIDFVRLFR